MKDIIKRGLRLLSMFLVVVTSSMMFLSSTVVSSPSSIDIDAINKQENQILKSDKPVKVSKPDEATVILTPEEAVRQANTSAKKRESFSKGLFSESKTFDKSNGSSNNNDN
ncbi:hypothetical protein [Dulcicalothrix desertica]|nr:hypothetical protein [Dulcicalothrix desertica]TWH54985.1 hypothetical protein CAL7102_03079 [Dulcicalothrix desertica PCC 7102]